MTNLAFIQMLLRREATGRKPPPQWSFVGSVAYLRASHGVFKIAPWDGGVHDRVAGLEGTYTSHTGAKDHVVFEFHDLLKPASDLLKNPDIVNTHRIHAWYTGDGPRRQIEWYVPPISLSPLHAEIDTWITVWGGR
jgi:hypothetical protein